MRRVAVDLRVGKIPDPTEHQEQSLLVQWTRTQLVAHPELRWVYAIPNQGGKGKGAMIRGATMLREGLQPGYPDLGLDVQRGGYAGLRIEMKRQHNVTVSPEQYAWRDWLMGNGYAWDLCLGWEHGRDVLLAYLALPRPAA